MWGDLVTCVNGTPQHVIKFCLQSTLDVGADLLAARYTPLDLANTLGDERKIQGHPLSWIAREGQARVLNGEFEAVKRRIRQGGLRHRGHTAKAAHHD
jgi:hypothetical protein